MISAILLPALALLANGAAVGPRQAETSATAIGMQAIPSGAPATQNFSSGAPQLNAEPPVTGDTPPALYGTRKIDIPFYRLYHGNINFFSKGQLNTPDQDTDVWGSQYDNVNQSACGIPDNAFSISKVAIHPYFLKYAGLDRKLDLYGVSFCTKFEFNLWMS